MKKETVRGKDIENLKDSTDKFYVQSLHRTFEIIEKISKSGSNGVSVTEISESTGLHISTVYRLLQNLVHWNYVFENGNGNYSLGLKLLELGAKVQENIEIRKVAAKYMLLLNEATRETIYLSILDRAEQNVLYIEKLSSRLNVDLVAGIGSRNFIHSTANGKCLMCGFSDEKIRKILSDKQLPKLTQNTITSVDQFIEEIHKVRKQNFAIDDLENEETVRCLASPVFDYRNSVVASISISGLFNTMTMEIINSVYIDLIKKTAYDISRELGYSIER